MKNFWFSIFVCCIALHGCSDMFEYSPYESDVSVSAYNSYSIGNLELVKTDTLKFVFMADPHGYYDELEEAVKRINVEKDISFVLVGGDITNFGLLKEYEWYYNIVKKLNVPVITVIGNHDYLSNGAVIFKKMFGPVNFTFQVGQYRFCIFDDVVWENKNQMPDFPWLQYTLEEPGYTNIVVAHIPPWSDQMSGEKEEKFWSVVNAENTLLSLHGHDHAFKEIMRDGLKTVVTGTIEYKMFCIVKLIGRQIEITNINY